MIEFTLLLPLLVTLFLGVVFFGQDLFIYNELEDASARPPASVPFKIMTR